MCRDARAPLVTLAVAFVPYLVFDLLFQETVTTRYALPLVPPMAYLAVRAGAGFERSWTAALVVLSVFNLSVGGRAVYLYSRTEAPAFRMLADMRERGSRPGTGRAGARDAPPRRFRSAPAD